MKFPTVKNIARYLRDINANVDGECDIRLQVYPDGEWALHAGDSSYDQDHRGYWGASSLPGYDARKNRAKRFPSFTVARDLIEQCKEQQESLRKWVTYGPLHHLGSCATVLTDE